MRNLPRPEIEPVSPALASEFLSIAPPGKSKETFFLGGGGQKDMNGTSLVVQWLRLHASNAGGVGLIPGLGTKSPHAARCGQKVIFIHNSSKLETAQMSNNK